MTQWVCYLHTHVYFGFQIRITFLKSECSIAWVGSFGNFNVGLGLNPSVLFSVPTCSSACWLPVAPPTTSSLPLGGLNVISHLFLLYCWPLISTRNESQTPTTLQMMMPCFHVFSMGLRLTHPHRLKVNFSGSGSFIHRLSFSYQFWITVMIGKLEANIQQNSSAGLSFDLM